MVVTDKIVSNFVGPWPILLPKGKYKVEFKTLRELEVSCKAWWTNNSEKMSLKEASTLISKHDLFGKRHQIHSLARSLGDSGHVAIIKNNVVIDGNHRLCALIHKKYRGYVLTFTFLRRNK